MKTIITILFLLGLYSCTFIDQANTNVKCPCQVTKIEYLGTKSYKITINEILSLNDLNKHSYIIFYTSIEHNIGDTIQ